MIDFIEFPKIARLRREIVVTEKIDGTNASVHVTEAGEVYAGSRTRWITPEADNFGFAAWVKANEASLRDGLGVGTHYGEWWRSGIQRGYGLTKGEKRFSLFNVARWADDAVRPSCCGVVPTLYRGPWSPDAIEAHVEQLRSDGSFAAPGFMRPEGVVVYHTAARALFKVTLEKDEAPKGKRAAEAGGAE